jgi:dipeptidyl aminopeptidase/acylaminoacyl peptidase
MKKKGGMARDLIQLLVLGMIIVFIVLVIQLLLPSGAGTQLMSQGGATPAAELTATVEAKIDASPGRATETGGQKPLPADHVSYPPPDTESPQPSPPTTIRTPIGTIAPFPETPPLTAGQAATLHNADIWLVEPGVQPKQLTEIGDVSVIFDWNRDGSKILYGRGSTLQAWGTTTGLWMLDLVSGKTEQVTDSRSVKSASWSPVDDRLAYCEYENVLTILDPKGEVKHQRDQILCQFTWSPDGEAIAVESYTPEMVDSDGLAYTVLGVWWLEEDQLHVFSAAKDEVHSSPVWSMDGRRILFVRNIFEGSAVEQTEQGLYIADLTTGDITAVRPSPTQAILGLTRSPQADLAVYRIGQEIYVTDFEGNSRQVGKGEPPNYPIWLPGGEALLHRAEGGNLQIIANEAAVDGKSIGGGRPALRRLEYYFRPGGDP